MFGKRIKECRESFNLSQEELSQVMGVSVELIKRWEQCTATSYKKCIDIRAIDKLCNFFGVETAYLFGIEVKKEGLDRAKEILCRQLELLAGKAHKAPANEMCSISESMVKIVDCINRIN